VSGKWVSFGAFAALALLRTRRGLPRRLIVLLFGGLLVLGFNFTSMLAFAVIMFAFEFGGLAALRGHLFALVRNAIPLLVIGAVVIGVISWLASERMTALMGSILYFQLHYALGTGRVDISALGLIAGSVALYLDHVAAYPFVLLVGDGFASFGLPKGGDVGFVETLANLGAPLYLAALLGLLAMIRAALRRRRLLRGTADATPLGRLRREAGRIEFAVCAVLFVLMAEGHYRVWPAKSVLPMLFVSVALLERATHGVAPA
jgi:hypothetical protein